MPEYKKYAYNTRKKSPEQLERELIGDERWDILNGVLKELELKDGEHPKQHWMIIGPRGIGKSHLLTLLYHKVKSHPELQKRWITVLFPEELRMANSLTKFLERAVDEVLEELESEKSPLEGDLRREIETIKKVLPSERNELLFSILSWVHNATGKFILLIIENMQQLLGKKLKDIEQKKLRAFLQKYENVLLIGSATTVFSALHDHKHPFYHFFHIRRLNDLSFDEIKTLILNMLKDDMRQELISRVNENEARLRALYSFTGGNPRMAVFLADILKTEVPDEMLDFMDEMLDWLTPYFEAILNDTPQYMEEVMNAIALYEPAQSPKEIADHLETPQTTIRNYLKQMKENGYVRVAFSKGKSNYYCLNEYLYRTWYQMRDCSHREETRWIMELMLMLYSPAAIMEEKGRLEKCTQGEIKSESYKRIIFRTADFIGRNPDFCRMIESYVESISSEEKRTNEKEKALFKEARKLRGKGNYEAAIQIYSNILIYNTNSDSAYGAWGACLRRQERYDEAIEKCKKAIEINPNSEGAYVLWGMCLISQEKYDEAIERFSRALQINPSSDQAYWYWGACLREQKKYEDAIEKFKKAAEINPDHACAYGAWGDCFRHKGFYKEAEEKYKKAVEVDPRYIDAYLAWGACLRRQERYDEAIEKCKKAIEINPNSEQAYCSWGDCLRMQKRYDEAIEKYKKAINLSPDFTPAIKRLIYSFYSTGRYNEAVELIERNQGILKDDCPIILEYGKSLFELQRYPEALKQFERVLDMRLDCYKTYIWHGMTLERLGHKETALIAYINHIRQNSIHKLIDPKVFDTCKEHIMPVLQALKVEDYIKQIYTSGDVKYSKPKLCTILLMLNKFDIVSEHFRGIANEYAGKEVKERADFDPLAFAVKLNIWLKLKEERLFEALRLAGLYADYINSMKSEKEKEEEVSRLLLSLFKLQFHFNVMADNVYKIIEKLKETGVPFNDLFFKVWKILSEPDSVDSQRYLTDKAIAELVGQIKEKGFKHICD